MAAYLIALIDVKDADGGEKKANRAYPVLTPPLSAR